MKRPRKKEKQKALEIPIPPLLAKNKDNILLVRERDGWGERGREREGVRERGGGEGGREGGREGGERKRGRDAVLRV